MFKAISVVSVGLWDATRGAYGLPGRLQNGPLVEFDWICRATEGDSPVHKRGAVLLGAFPSNAGHVEPRMNLGGPSPKAKYYSVTDSEPVP